MSRISKYGLTQIGNIDANIGWETQTVEDISSAAQVVHAIAADTFWVQFYSQSDIYIDWGLSSSGTNVTANDIIYPANTIVFLRVPKELLKRPATEILYLYAKQVISVASKSLRIVQQ